jgi:hypothetical protein
MQLLYATLVKIGISGLHAAADANDILSRGSVYARAAVFEIRVRNSSATLKERGSWHSSLRFGRQIAQL